jgi:hypothetical protein
MDRLLLLIGTLLERSRTYITKIAVPAFSIVETLDVIKDILLGIIARHVIFSIYPLPFEDSEEAFNDGIVVAVSSAAHAALDLVRL